MIKTPTVPTITTTAQVIYTEDKSGASRPGTWLFRNTGSETVYVGGGYVDQAGNETIEVTTSNGFPVEANEVLSLDLIAGESVYALTQSGTSTGRLLRTNG